MGMRSLKPYPLIYRLTLLLSLAVIIGSCSTSRKAVIESTESYQPHTVLRGETVSKIAGTYEVTVADIIRMNPGMNINNIRPGQILKIPFKKPEPKKEVEEVKEVPPEKRDLIKIALLLPFNAADNASHNQSDGEIKVDAATIPWIQFYEGAMLAVDSFATREGTSFEISLYDSWSDAGRLGKLVRDSLFVKNDLVIGSGVTNLLPALVKASEQHKKPLIITQNNSASFLEGHPELLLTMPSVALQCQLMSEYIYKNYGRENLVILHQDNKKEKDFADLFSTALQVSHLGGFFTSDSLKVKSLAVSDKIFEKGFNLFNKDKKNIVIIQSSDEAFVSPIISRLDSLDEFSFVVCGIPTWENFESIDPEMLQRLNTLIFSPSYVDYGNPYVKSFRKQFIEKYKSDPSYQGYLGFSIAYLSAMALEKHGHADFAKTLERRGDRENTLPAGFDFKSKSTADGRENHRISILKFENYRLVPVD